VYPVIHPQKYLQVVGTAITRPFYRLQAGAKSSNDLSKSTTTVNDEDEMRFKAGEMETQV
jgi:hypothetical protein